MRTSGIDDQLPAEAHAAALAGLPGMGPARLAAVVAALPPEVAWGSLVSGERAGLDVLRGAVQVRHHKEDLVSRWSAAAAKVDVGAVWDRLVALRLGVALHGRPGYPDALAHDVEPPALLFHRGGPENLRRRSVAVVGTRRCTSQGSGIAFELGRDLAHNGVAVVSGLASGIDAAAHRGALSAGGAPPVGVIATGIDVVYPRRQNELWDQVAAAGVLLGEAPPGTPPERWRFPARNRIIAALADIVVVVESHARGGALHTVDEADRRSVDVMVVPGSVRNPASSGTNGLLAEGRAPVRSAEDVLLALGLSTHRPPVEIDGRRPPSSDDAEVLEALGWQPASLDHLVLRTSRAVPSVAASLDRLASAGWVARRSGWYERVAGQWSCSEGLP